MIGHGRELCGCGRVLAQCRCFACNGRDWIRPGPCRCPEDGAVLCTRRLGHGGQCLHDPAQDVIGSCGRVAGRLPPKETR